MYWNLVPTTVGSRATPQGSGHFVEYVGVQIFEGLLSRYVDSGWRVAKEIALGGLSALSTARMRLWTAVWHAFATSQGRRWLRNRSPTWGTGLWGVVLRVDNLLKGCARWQHNPARVLPRPCLLSGLVSFTDVCFYDLEDVATYIYDTLGNHVFQFNLNVNMITSCWQHGARGADRRSCTRTTLTKTF